MTGEQNNESMDIIDRATTFEEALYPALDVVKLMLYCQENIYLDPIVNEVINIDADFQQGEITQHTLTSFYSAVLLFHSNLILFSDLNKSYKLAKECSSIHLKYIRQIKSLETPALKQGYCPQDNYKYLKIWKELLKDIIDLCFKYSTNHKGLSNNVAKNQNLFTILGSIFSNFSTIMLKRRSWPKVSIKWSRNSATEDETSNQSQSPASENSEKLSGRFKVSGENLHVAITIIVFVIGITLALTFFR
jgi:hypothetical protein